MMYFPIDISFSLPSEDADELDVETVRDILGVIKENIFLDIIKNIEQKNNQNVINQLNNIIDEEASLGVYILCAADMNTDGVVNVVDVVAIVNIVLGNGRAYIEDAT